jgi:hypothetical protein
MVYDRAHTREIPKLGGFAKKMPLAAIAFILGGLASMGMPGLSGFVAEFPLLWGVWQRYPLVAIVASVGVVVTAAYILLLIRRVFFGTMPAELERQVPNVQGVWIYSEARTAFTVVSIKQSWAGHAAEMAMAVAGTYAGTYRSRFIIIVDEDIDPFDMHDVEYAVATRVRGDRDILVITGARGSSLDPCQLDDGTNVKVGVDATMVMGEEERFRRAGWS